MITYREFAPAPELADRVRAYFSFAPEAPRIGQRTVTREVVISRDEPFDLPLLADARTSLVLDLGATCHVGQGWRFGTPLGGRAIGALRAAGPIATVRSEMIGAYLEPGATLELLSTPTVELTDIAVGLDDLWGTESAGLVADLAELSEDARVDRLEAVLLERLRRAATPARNVDVLGLARWARSDPAGMTVSRLASAAGVSRRHLTRVFRQMVGVTPKRFCRLARFQAGLRYAGAGTGVRWSQVAAALGYADQSHMIAEFRELGGLTPQALAARRWFHPFIWDARSR